ncbi:MAG TPA: TRASH domain-containing protein [Thermoplasmatales archaeon]|nr:TRASH domain-containing protein [Thermoplasmatales archaeon]
MAKKCNFCGNEIEPGTGLMYVKKDGTIYYFCSSKCRKNMLELGRDPKKVRWTKFYRKRT